MKCPIDETELQMTERQGVEIDYCPKCRGVWLDRGELDKIIDKATPASTPDTPERYPDERRYGDEHDSKYRKHKRGGLLGEMFDF